MQENSSGALLVEYVFDGNRIVHEFDIKPRLLDQTSSETLNSTLDVGF